MFSILFMDDGLMMEIVFYFILFFNLLIITFRFASKNKYPIKYLVIGNLTFLLQHLFVLISIYGTIKFPFIVNILEILTMMFYSIAILRIFDINIVFKKYIIYTIAAFIAIFIVVSVDYLYSSLRIITNLIIVIVFIDTLYSLQKNKFKKQISTYKYIVAIVFVFILLKLTVVVFRVYSLSYESSIESIQTTVVLFTFFTLLLAIGVNIGVLFCQFDKLYLKIENLSYTDFLTKLYNRRYIIQKLDESMELYLRDKLDFAVVLFDIDKFKQINDKLSHQIGDEILIGVADIVKSSIRSIDIVSRYGGDEFLLLLTVDDEKTYQYVIERVVNSINSILISEALGSVQISGGAFLSFEHSKIKRVDEIIDYLDKLLYQAKELEGVSILK